MAEIKTKQTNENVHDFIESFANTEQKRKDSYEPVSYTHLFVAKVM